MPAGKAQQPSRPRDLSGYLEAMSRAVFQAGISWHVVDAKWDGIREAFDGFNPCSVAELDAADIEALMDDRRVIRHRAKLEGTVDNAQTLLELDAEHGSFRHYLRSQGDFDATVGAGDDLREPLDRLHQRVRAVKRLDRPSEGQIVVELASRGLEVLRCPRIEVPLDNLCCTGHAGMLRRLAG